MRDDVDGNKCRSILTPFITVTDTVSICTYHYMLFPFLLLHAASFWTPQHCDMQNGHFYCWSKSHCSNISLVLLNKWKYKIQFKIQTNISDRFRAFPWHLQTTTEPEIELCITLVPLLSVSSPCHHSLSKR